MMHRVLAAMLAIQVILYYLSPLHYWNHGTDLFLPKWLVMAQVPSLPQPNPMIDRTSFITVHASREHFEVGASSLFAGDFRAALDALKSSWELHPVELTSQLIVYCLESLQANESSGSRAISTDILWWRDAGKVIAATENPRERVYRISRLLRLQGDVRSAAGTLKSYIVEHPDDVAFSFELGCLLKDLGSTGEAAVMFERTLEMSPSFFKARLNLAAMYQSFNDLDRSITQYRLLLSSLDMEDAARLGIMARSNLAAVYYLNKMTWEAIFELKMLTAMLLDRLIKDCSAERSPHTFEAHESWHRAWSVLMSLNRTFDFTNISGFVCEKSDSVSLSGECHNFVDYIGISVMHLVIFQRSVCSWEGLETLTMGFLIPETLRVFERIQSGEHFAPEGSYVPGPTLPFESLLMPISLKIRLSIAKIRSFSINRKSEVIKLDRRFIPSQCSLLRLSQGLQDCDTKSKSEQIRRNLVLGYLSYDFNEHPTAHLVEALFFISKSCRFGNTTKNSFCERLKHASGSNTVFDHVENIAFNYGSIADSNYRGRLMSSADKFIDLLVQSHETSAKFIVNNQVDILLDMQLYTLGNRAEIVASRPAPVIVNYLVYPGTSGSEAHDYIVVDRIVAPPEHSQHYAERLLLLPPSYQVSIYDHLEGMPDFQKEDGSRDNARDDQILKICNFNKIDKLDPLSFRMWMQILRRVPRSRLYLLEPITSEEQKSIPPNSGPPPNVMAKRNLIDELQAEGFVYSEGNESTPSSRMEFYPRVSKVDHVRRQSDMDLFIDTLVYGAHSTATDALRANLPVLTIEGDSFPNRVGVSLYESFCNGRSYDKGNSTSDAAPRQSSTSSGACRALCDDPDLLRSVLAPLSLKSFEDTAVMLLSKPGLLRKLKQRIAFHVSCKHGIFDSLSSTLHFFHGMEAISDVYAHYKRKLSPEIDAERPPQLAHIAVSSMMSLEG